ncbi:CoA-binding protein [bacterium]|nr:CoA-binding protein [bacterium]
MRAGDMVISATEGEIKEIFTKTQTIAIVGLSPKPEKDSNKVAEYLQMAGYRIIPIYPQAEVILGEKVYRNLDEIDEVIDLVNIFRKTEFIATIVDKVLARDDVKCVWTQLNLVDNLAAKKVLSSGRCVVQDLCTKIEHQRLFPAS